ncbi:MAG: NPCBM/NEW2 domain-containing protein [Verrucomicrobia bacterium]|nr:NPCBM/NEW2 domain-containing protein [Verrucomicrobiota bacterium]
MVALGVAAGFDARAQPLTVDWNSPRQEMDGFGVAFPGAAMWIKNFTEPARSRILDVLFSVTNGAGFTIIRNEIIADDHDAPNVGTTGAGTWQPNINSHEPIEGTWNWTGDESQVWLMQQAKRYGVTNFLSTVWSAPPWMKSNDSYRGDVLGPGGETATLLTNKHQAYADYLSRYVREYHSRFGLDISAVSIVNEPGFPAHYQGMLMDPPQMVDFLKNFLKPTFVRDGVTARIVAPEDASWEATNRIAPLLADPGAAAAINIIASHGYHEATNPMPAVKAAGKRLWMTEISELNVNTNSMADALRWVRNLHGHLTVAETQAWLWWYAAAPVVDDHPGALMFLTYTTPWYAAQRDTFRYPKRLWAIANYSRFIRPGFVRLPVGGNAPAGLLVSAFKSADGAQFVAVAVNDSDVPQTLTLQISGGGNVATLQPYVTSATQDLQPVALVTATNGIFTATLAPRSVTSFAKVASPLPPAPTDDTWVSDLEWANASIAGIDPPQRDRTAVGPFWYGSPITLGGTNHAKGLGFSAPSTIIYHLNGQGDRFTALAGLTKISVTNKLRFQVWGDDTLLFDGSSKDGEPPLEIDVSVRGKKFLKLTGLSESPGGSAQDDQGAWASAQVTHAGPRLASGFTPNGMTISLTVGPGESCVLEKSTDLRTWTPIQTNSSPSGVVQFLTPPPTGSNAFFRVKKP